MNPAFEAEAEGEVIAAAAPKFPEIPDDVDEVKGEQLLALYEETIKGLPSVNQHTLAAYADAVDQVKLAAKNMETIRKKKVDPLNADLKRINGAYIPFVEKFTAMAKRLAELPNRWIDEQERLRQEEQRRLNAEAEQKQLELDRKAEEARKAAAAAIESGDTKEAAKQEAKAEQLEQKAATVTTQVVQSVEKAVDLGESKVSFGGKKMVWALTGWDKAKPLDLNSPLLASLIGDVSALPPGVQFLLKTSQLVPTKLNKLYGIEPFPKPFTEMPDFSGSRRTS